MTTLKIQNLTAGYGKMEVLHKLNLEIKENEKIVAFTGPNGAGKSTLFKTIMGLTNVFSGSIFLNGEDITKLGPNEIVNKGVTLVPQDDNIFPSLSVRKNLKVSCIQADKMDKLLNYTFSLFPMLKEREGQRAESLSGGEKRMLAIGCGLMTSVDFLLVDEPCSGIQPSITAEIREKLSSLDIKIAWIEVENYQTVFNYADKCYVMSAGEITYEGDPKKAIRQREVEKALFGSSKSTCPPTPVRKRR